MFFRIAFALLGIVLIVAGVHALLTLPIALWGGIAMWCALLLLAVATVLACVWYSSFFGLVFFAYAVVLVGRLFGTVHLSHNALTQNSSVDPLLVGETGDGVSSVLYVSYLAVVFVLVRFLQMARTSIANTEITLQDWGLTFIRIYVGLMFIAHYSGHVLAGKEQFSIFAEYFAGVGFHIGGPMVILAGAIEIAVSIALAFGIMTRMSAFGAVAYLFFATLWGDHFAVGYVWVLPTGGWEFSALWMAIIAVFLFIGGNKLSFDYYFRTQWTLPRKWHMLWLFR